MPITDAGRERGEHLLTNSRIASFLQCRYKHWAEYILGVRRAPSEALRIGGGVHDGLHVLKSGGTIDEARNAILDKCAKGMPLDNEELAHRLEHEAQKVLCLVEGWHNRWGDQDGKHALNIVRSEMSFDIPLRNPATGRPSRVFRLAGKLDALCLAEAIRLALLEHKTTGEDIGSDADYWLGLRLDRQISVYMIASHEQGDDVEAVFYDVIRKPGIQLLKATPIERRKYRQKDGELYAGMRENDETIGEYGLRLAADIALRPEWYYQRREIPRLASDLDKVRRELWQIQCDIREAIKTGHHYRDTSACRVPYPCPLRGVCSEDIDLERETPEGFVRLNYLHPELEKADDTTNGTAASETVGETGNETGTDAGTRETDLAYA